MRIIPNGSIVVTGGDQFISLRGGDEVEVADDVAARLIDGGHAVAVDAPVETPVVSDPEPAPSKPAKRKRLDAAPENKAD